MKIYKTHIVCIGGKAQHGKDTTAAFLQEHLVAYGKNVLIAHQADLLKNMARDMFGWDGKKDEKGRHLLQFLGTDTIRKRDPDFWVDHLVRTFKALDGTWDIILIPDTRFPNEIEKFRESGFVTTYIRVNRSNFESPLTEEQQKHISEIALDDYPSDVLVENRGTVDELKGQLESVAAWLSIR